MTLDQIEVLKARDDVIGVWEDELMQLTTNTSPDYLELTGGGDPWSKGYVGEDVIIGVLDSGIQPDHPSLADVPTPKKGNKGPKIPFGAPPTGWTGTGCEFGNTAFNPLDAPFTCNNKLLKAESFGDTFKTFRTLATGEFDSARDSDGHGTHTATTAGGNNGVPADIDGVPMGTVSGMAPRARIAIYKVCWDSEPITNSGCFSSDSMAGIDQAVADGVDVINFSVGGASTNFNGPDDVAFLFAAQAGVWVATSQGNGGPGAQTTGTPAGVPWITAVGAAQDDQVFGTGLLVTAPVSVADTYEALEGVGGVSLSDTGDISASVVPSEPANGCAPLTNGAAISGNIALAIRGGCTFSTKYNNAAAAGATAIVVYNDGTTPARVDPITMSAPGTTIPGIMIGFFDGDLLSNTAGVTGTVGPSIVIPRDNRIAGFSSRGPNGGAPDIIKPDVAAPGVQILAGETLFPNVVRNGGQFFQSISGTSMSSPHVAGTFALLKEAYPDWSAAMARSALMTTARQDLKKTFGEEAADPFDIGAGHIVPGDAFDPGLAYDADIFDYVRFTCGADTQPQIFTAGTCAFFGSIDSSDLNLPSIGIAELVYTQTITRTVTSVANNNGKKSYTVSVDAPPGVDVSVSPSTFKLRRGESATYEVTFTTNSSAVIGEWSFGSLTWTHGGEYSVRSPIAVRPTALAAPDEVAVEDAPSVGSVGYDVDIGFEGNFAAAARGLEAAEVQPDSVATGDATLHFVFVPPGTRLARFSLFDESVGDGTGSDDLDLQVQGPDSAGFPFVAFSGSPTSEEQIDLVDPDPGFYAVFVIHFSSVNPVTPYELNFWDVGPNLGNMNVTAPTNVSPGTTESVTVDWNGLGPATKYRGIVEYSNDDGDLGFTIISVDTL